MGLGAGGALQSPYTYEARDYLGRVLRISIPFNTTTGALQDATVTRDRNCDYSTIYIGLGADGTVETTPYQFNVPQGTTTVTATQMANKGLNVINDVNSLQITAG